MKTLKNIFSLVLSLLFMGPVFAQDLKEILLDHFTLEEANSPLEKAQVIILGDPNHLDKGGDRIRLKLINLLRRHQARSQGVPPRVSVHLVEKLDSNTQIPSRLLHRHPDFQDYLPGIILGGWNNLSQQTKAIAFLKKSRESQLKLQEIGQRKSNLQGLALKGSKSSEKIIKAIKLVQEEFDQCKADQEEASKAFYRISIGERNKHMIQTMENVLKGPIPQVRLFLSSGSGHFDPVRVSRWAGPDGDVLAYLRRENIPFVYLKTLSTTEKGGYGTAQMENRDNDFHPSDAMENALPQLVMAAHKHLALMNELKAFFGQ